MSRIRRQTPARSASASEWDCPESWAARGRESQTTRSPKSNCRTAASAASAQVRLPTPSTARLLRTWAGRPCQSFHRGRAANTERAANGSTTSNDQASPYWAGCTTRRETARAWVKSRCLWLFPKMMAELAQPRPDHHRKGLVDKGQNHRRGRLHGG